MKIGPVLSIFWEKIGPNVIYLALKNAMLSIFGPKIGLLLSIFWAKIGPVIYFGCYL